MELGQGRLGNGHRGRRRRRTTWRRTEHGAEATRRGAVGATRPRRRGRGYEDAHRRRAADGDDDDHGDLWRGMAAFDDQTTAAHRNRGGGLG
ncbi:hypothetical protein E2562_009081 [Oryza meyeriana var. granulata]|uniref:Uncharacterized protein n=1 Tax=Oryza meyeriana var. granulata TaxID=110450 RepID=A0A6G1D1Q4_9ORYZ|nr:hypothetical protein E2562_009081 [Oryza meyeriana var. granulata]